MFHKDFVYLQHQTQSRKKMVITGTALQELIAWLPGDYQVLVTGISVGVLVFFLFLVIWSTIDKKPPEYISLDEDDKIEYDINKENKDKKNDGKGEQS